jgi:hypothetical protein
MRKPYFFILSIIFVLLILPGCISIKTKQGSDGGIFKSSDFGEIWQQKVYVSKIKKQTITISDVSVSNLLFNPNDSNVIYLSTTSNGIYKTLDGGETWKQTGLKTGNSASIAFDQKNPEILYTVSGGKILKSVDGGDNWQNIYIETRAGQSISSIAADFYNTNKIYASVSDGTILRSTDYGNTWSVLTRIGDYINQIYIYPSDSRIIFLVTRKKGIFKSLDDGENWTQINTSLSKFKGGLNINWFLFYKKDPTKIYLATGYGLLKSSDGGATWGEIKTLLPSGTPIQSVAVDPNDENKILFAIDNKIHKSLNSGSEWSVKVIPTSRKIVLLLADPENSETIYAGAILIKKK